VIAFLTFISIFCCDNQTSTALEYYTHFFARLFTIGGAWNVAELRAENYHFWDNMLLDKSYSFAIIQFSHSSAI
jgi:hypothetical protein